MARISTWSFDPATGANPEILGLPHEQVSGITDAEYVRRFVHPADRQRVLDAYASVAPDRPDFQVGYRILRADGVTRSVLEQAESQFDGDGRMLSQAGVLQDVTERVESEARYRRLFEFSPVSLCEADWSGVCRALEGLGIDDPEALGEYLDGHPGELERLAAEARVLDVNQTTLR